MNQVILLILDLLQLSPFDLSIISSERIKIVLFLLFNSHILLDVGLHCLSKDEVEELGFVPEL